MYLKKISGPRAINLPNGTIMTLADLPPANTSRWVASRKATVVRAVVYGLITQDAALERYSLSVDEFREWVMAITQHGEEALKATAVQRFR